MKLFYTILFLVFSFFVGKASDTIRVDINTLNDSIIKVKIQCLTEKENCFASNKFIESFSPKVFPHNNIGVYQNDSSVKSIELNMKGFFNFDLNDNVYISYEVTSNYGKKNIFIPVSTLFEDDFQLYSWNHIIPFNLFDNDDTWQIYVNNQHIDATTFYKWSNQSYVIANPSFLVDETAIYVRNNPFTSDTLQQWIKEVIEAIETYKIDKTDKEFVFLFDTLGKQSGAIAQNNMLVFYFDEKDYQKEPKYLIQKTLTHELLHWYLDKGTDWTDEAIPEYMAHQILLKNDLISQKEFLQKMEDKCRTADEFKDYSLAFLEKNVENSIGFYESFYTKGVIAVWLADCFIQNQTNYNLLDIIDLRINKEKQDSLLIMLKEFRERYLEDNQTIPYNDYLNDFGIRYEYQKTHTFYPSEEIKFDGDLEIIDNADFEELMLGDFILSVNGKKTANEINEELKNPTSNILLFLVKRNDKKVKIDFPIGKKKAKIIHHNFSFMKNPTLEQEENWDNYINGID